MIGRFESDLLALKWLTAQDVRSDSEEPSKGAEVFTGDHIPNSGLFPHC